MTDTAQTAPSTSADGSTDTSADGSTDTFADGSTDTSANGSSEAPQLPDPRPLLATAAGAASAVILAVGEDQVNLPTPCDEFRVLDLIDHLRMVAVRTGHLGRGEDAFLEGSDDPGGLSLEQLQTVWTSQIADAQTAWQPDETLDRTITMPWATLPAPAALLMYVSEITVHTWDLARATGQQPQWDPAVVVTSLGLMKVGLPADQRDQAPFSPVVAVDDDAQLIDHLVGWTGRDPAWA